MTNQTLSFKLRPTPNSPVQDLFQWRTMLRPVIKHFHLKDDQIKIHFKLSDGYLVVTLKISEELDIENVKLKLNKLIGTTYQLWW